jgi:hypothetical protein
VPRLVLARVETGRRRVRAPEVALLLTRPRLGERRRRRLLDVRAVVARVGEDERILSRVGDHHELLRGRAADRARVRFHERVLEPTPLEDATVRAVHLLVVDVEARLVEVEGIRVLHQELAPAEQPEARTDLVAELRPDLVEVERQLPPRRDGAAHHVRDGLFGRRRERERARLAVLEVEEDPLVDVAVPAPRLHPELLRLEDRQVDLHRARRIHLLPHDLDHLLERAEAERRERVDPRGELVDEARAVEELMRDDVRVAGDFTERDEERLRPAHKNRGG